MKIVWWLIITEVSYKAEKLSTVPYKYTFHCFYANPNYTSETHSTPYLAPFPNNKNLKCQTSAHPKFRIRNAIIKFAKTPSFRKTSDPKDRPN